MRRPSHIHLDYSHPLANRLRFACLSPSAEIGGTRCPDSSIYKNHGAGGSAFDITQWVWLPPLQRYGLNFTTTDNDNIVLPSLNNSQTEWTIAAWCYARDLTNGRSAFGGDGNQPTIRVLNTRFNSSCYTNAAPSGWIHTSVSSNNKSINTWYHVCVTYDGSTDTSRAIFVNGVSDYLGGTVSASKTLGSNPNWAIGGELAVEFSLNWDGYVADAMFWDRSLTNAEIAQLANPANVFLSGMIRSGTNTKWTFGSVTDDLVGIGVTSGTPTVGTPTLGQTHALVASGVTIGNPTVGSPTLGQVHSLSATEVTSGTPALGTPTLYQAQFTVQSPSGSPWTSGSPVTFTVDYTGMAAGYSFIDWDNTLKLWWRFDNDATKGEDATTVYDWSGNGHWGVITGGISYGTGQFGGSLNCANTGYVKARHDASWIDFLAEEDITIALWTKITDDANHNYLIQLAGHNSSALTIYRHINGLIIVRLYNPNTTTLTDYLTAASFPADGTWHHLAVVIKKATPEIRYYFDGVYIESDTPADPIPYLSFNSIFAGGTYFVTNGEIDELLVFSRGLSDSEIEALHGVELDTLSATQSVSELETHTYQVSHVDTDGVLYQSDEELLLIDQPNTGPTVTLLTPVSGTRKDVTTATLTFSATSTNTGVALATATLFFGTAPESLVETQTIPISGGTDEDSFSVAGVSAGTYYWRVDATDANANSGSSAVATFIVGQSAYHVATTGNDTNVGTEAAPFLTIQKFCDIAKPGDTCTIHGGTYREAITLSTSGTARDRITIQPAVGETVVINGTDLLTTWTNVSGSIYKATFAGDLGRGLNQLFVNGVMVAEARHPNDAAIWDATRTSFDIDAGSSYNSTTMTILDADLTEADNFWVGATVHAIWNPRYHALTGIVTASTSGQLTVTLDTVSAGYGTMTSYGLYYLSGIRNALDQAGEWALDTGEIYLWAPGSEDPDTLSVEIKQRQTGLTIDASYVTINDIQLFACNAVLTPESSYATLDGITGDYLFHYSVLNASTMGTGYQGLRNTGLVIDGHHHAVQNSTLRYSSGNGISLLGHHNTANTCDISFCNWMITECAAISMGDCGVYNNAVTNCELHKCGRALLEHSGATLTNITYNILHEETYDTWSWDTGAMYAITSNGQGAEVAYNYVRDCRVTGIYFDYGCWGYHIHHNVIEDTPSAWYIALLCNEVGGEFVIEHNTLEGDLYHDRTSGLVTYGNYIRNNIAETVRVRVGSTETPFVDATEGVESNNIEIGALDAGQQAALFIDQANDDFHLGPTSVAIDYGLDLGYTVDFDGHPRIGGAAPDAGAYELQHSLSATGITSGTPVLGTPTLGQTHALTATGVTSGIPTLGTTTLGQTHALTAVAITSGIPVVGSPTLAEGIHNLVADGVVSGVPILGIPSLGQIHALTASGVTTGIPTLGSPSVGQTYALTASGVTIGAPTVGTPTLAQVHALTASGTTLGTPTVGTPTLGQLHVLVAMAIAASAPTVGTPSLDRLVAFGTVTCRITSASSGVSFSSRKSTLTFSAGA